MGKGRSGLGRVLHQAPSHLFYQLCLFPRVRRMGMQHSKTSSAPGLEMPPSGLPQSSFPTNDREELCSEVGSAGERKPEA